MREEFHLPNEFHSLSEYHQEENAQEYHALPEEYCAPKEEYCVPKEEGIAGQAGPATPPKPSMLRKMRKMLYAVSVSVFVTVSAQAAYPDFVVFPELFSPSQAEETLPIPTETLPIPTETLPIPTETVPTLPAPIQVWTDCPNCEGGLLVCPVCQGDWEHGAVEVVDTDCPYCEDGIILRREEIYIYNGTPCKFCNDVGTFVNMDGVTEECGECRGYASRHQVGEKQVFEYYNGDYREYAFDPAEEYVPQDCPECGGSGFFREEAVVPCKECSNGSVVCPVCNGEGGYYTEEAQ